MSKSILVKKKGILNTLIFCMLIFQLFYFPLFSQENCIGMNSLNEWVTQGIVKSGNVGEDYYGGFPIAGPASGYSIQVGDKNTFPQPLSSASRTFTVSAATPFLEYYFAMVNLDYPHSTDAAANSTVQILDPSGNAIPCTYYRVFAADGGPAGFVKSAKPQECNYSSECTYAISYLPWKSSIVDLTAYIGQNVTIQLTNKWCLYGPDWGYTYFDAQCVNFEIQQTCLGSSTTLVAPSGGSNYLWSTGENTHSITISKSGTYSCVITPAQGSDCNISLSINATIIPFPEANFTVNTSTTCAGGEIQFTDNSKISAGGVIKSYQWDFGDGITTASGIGAISGVSQTSGTYQNPRHLYNLVGTHDATLTVVSEFGCTNSFKLPITIINAPTASISGTTSICQNDISPKVIFTGAGTAGPFNFSYNINNGPIQTISTLLGNKSIEIPVSTNLVGTFKYNLLNVSDPTSATCSQTQAASTTITVNPLPTAKIMGTVSVCKNDPKPTITFTGSNSTAPYIFTYNINGGTNQIITSVGGNTVTINAPTDILGQFTYNLVNVQDASLTSCSQSQKGSETITIKPLPTATISGTKEVCQYEESPKITFTGANGKSPYTFYYNIDGVTNKTITSIGSTVTIDASTETIGKFTYNLVSVKEASSSTCAQEQVGTVNILVKEANPKADFHASPQELSIYQLESQMINQTSGASSYEWYFGDGDYSDLFSPIHTFPSDTGGVYNIMLIAISNAGCRDTAYGTVNVKEELLFWVPNTFTPDGDQKNENFKPIFTTGYDEYSYNLSIFNRWGELLFESHDTKIGWDGTYGGKLMQDGTYTWKISVKHRKTDKREMFSGHVNILK